MYKLKTHKMRLLIMALLFGIFVLAGCGGARSSENAKGESSPDGKTSEKEGNDSDEQHPTDNTNAANKSQTLDKDDTSDIKDTMDKNTEDKNTTDNKNMIYIALGDSLTKGYGLADADNDRFSAVVAQKLNAAGIGCIERNYGVNGLTSGELLDMINGGKIGMLDYADIITVDIGANDVLHAADELIYTNLAGNTLSADDYSAVCTEEETSLAQCKENTEAIIKALRAVNDHALIVMFTIYNPYRNVDLDLMVEGENLTLAGFTDNLVKRLNENIKDIAYEQVCIVGDWYTAFEINPNNLVNASYGDGVTTNFDIHPNRDGHAVMGEVCYQAVKSSINNK